MQMRGIKALFAAGAVAMTALVGFVVVGTQVDAKGDCSANSVIKCGSYELQTLRDKYNSDSTPGTKNIYNWFGITSDIVNNANVKEGYVTKGGAVTVDGQTVATGAMTAGRQYIAGGSTKQTSGGTTFYSRSPSVSFRSNSLSAFVFFDAQGRFIGAVIKDCGNPVKATNKIEVKQVVYTCDGLSQKALSRNEYEFTASATASEGASIKGYVFDYGDGTTEAASAPTRTHTYAQAGTYTASVSLRVLVNGKVITMSDDKCKVTVTVAEEKKPAVTIEKTVNGQKNIEVKYDQDFTYELTVRNTGDTDLKSAVVTDNAPDGVTFKSADKGTVSNNKWSYTLDLAVGQSETINIKSVVTKSTKTGPFVNEACVDAKEISGSPDACDKATVTVKVYVCDTTDNTLKYVSPAQANDSRYTTDLTQCDEVTVCNPETGKTMTVKKSEESNYLPADSEKCSEQPVVPELPHTGMGDVFGGIMGAGALTMAGYYYIASRRSL